MTTSLRSVGLLVASCVLWSQAVGAQTSTPTPPPASQTSEDTRPATTTFLGDTGLWFVPTAEVLGHRKWSISGYRRGTDWKQGYTNVADFAGTFAVGLTGRAEIFGSFLFDTRIDRDIKPMFVTDPAFGGVIDRYPRVNQPWTGNNVGDLYVGAKINLLSEFRRNPLALAVRGVVKAPTGKKDVGVSTGKPDVFVDLIASKEVARVVEMAAYGGYEALGKADGLDAPSGALRWGAGAAFPSRSPLRVTAELNGNVPSSDTATLTTALTGIDGSVSPLVSNTENITRATAGLTFQHKGFFVGGGLSWNVPRIARDPAHTDENPFADYLDWQVRIGYHPGVRVYVPPPPPPPPLPPPPPPPAPREHTLAVKAQCDPCTVNVGETSMVTSVVQDSIACVVTYRWTTPTGTLANPAVQNTVWTAPQQEGSVPVTITVTCPTDNKMASDTVNIQVVRPVAKAYTFEDVHFDFDRYSLRPEATRILDEAVSAMNENATLRLTIEGHTCSIGTAEYNLALGDRRANAVLAYLTSRGIAAARLMTVSYGEEQPKYDNAREETRRLNRRAALVVKLQ